MRRSLRRMLSASIALVYVLIAAGPLSASVLCAGSDGHVAIESAFLDECCPEAEAAVAEIAATDDCTDTPIVVDGAIPKKQSAADAPALHVVAVSAVSGATGFPGAASWQHDDRPPGDVTHRRTIVLRI